MFPYPPPAAAGCSKQRDSSNNCTTNRVNLCVCGGRCVSDTRLEPPRRLSRRLWPGRSAASQSQQAATNSSADQQLTLYKPSGNRTGATMESAESAPKSELDAGAASVAFVVVAYGGFSRTMKCRSPRLILCVAASRNKTKPAASQLPLLVVIYWCPHCLSGSMASLAAATLAGQFM